MIRYIDLSKQQKTGCAAILHCKIAAQPVFCCVYLSDGIGKTVQLAFQCLILF